MQHDKGIASRSFRGELGGGEHFISVEASAGLAFAEQLHLVEERYAAARKDLGLAPESAIFRRVFVSDLMNQAQAVRASSLCGTHAEGPVAVSIVQQAPLPGAKIALLAYHLTGDAGIAKERLSPHHVLVEKRGLRHLWSTRLCAGSDKRPRIGGRPDARDLRRSHRDAGRCRRHAPRPLRAHLDLRQGRRRLLPGHGREPPRAVRAARPDRGHALPRQHRHRGRLRAPLRPRGDGRLFHPRPGAGADVVPQRLRPAVPDQGLRRHLRARHAHRLCRPLAPFHLRNRQHRRGPGPWSIAATCCVSSSGRSTTWRRCCARDGRAWTT